MKKLLLALIVSAPVMATTFADDYRQQPDFGSKQALMLAEIVKAFGYRCDVINSASRSAWSNGKYKLVCNNWSYVYTVEDKGGRAVVTVE